MRHLILLTLLFSLSATTLSCAQSKTSQKERFQFTYNEMKALITSKAYKFTGDYVYNNKQREKVVNDLNTITVNQSELSGKTSALGAQDKTIEINSKISNYNVNFDDDSQHISIEINTDGMNFYIDIKPNGNAFLAIKNENLEITQVGKIIKA